MGRFEHGAAGGDHGSLSGLADDDHPQYLTQAEGDARYADQSHEDTHRNAGTDPLVQAAVVNTGSIAALATADILVAWPTAFPSGAYAPSAAVQNTEGDLRVLCIIAKVAASVTVRVQNVNGVSARSGSVSALAVRT